MAKGFKTGGRVKGTPNKLTGIARDAIATAADELGGAERLAQWAKESPDNERAFWVSIYPKLVPVQNELSSANGTPIFSVQLVPLKAAGDDHSQD